MSNVSQEASVEMQTHHVRSCVDQQLAHTTEVKHGWPQARDMTSAPQYAVSKLIPVPCYLESVRPASMLLVSCKESLKNGVWCCKSLIVGGLTR